jgi:hypothetical protein
VARAEPLRVVLGAILIFGPFVVIEIAADVFVELYREHHSGVSALVALALVPVTSATVAGSVLYAGALDRIVGAHHYGGERHPALDLVRRLPLKRLVIADVVLVFVVVGGLALFVVPGLVALTLFSLVGPMVTIEERSVRGAFARSARLVRPHFVLVFGLVTLPLIVEEVIFHTLFERALEHPGFVTYALDGLVVALVGGAIGVIEVTLAYDLSRRSPDA